MLPLELDVKQQAVGPMHGELAQALANLLLEALGKKMEEQAGEQRGSNES